MHPSRAGSPQGYQKGHIVDLGRILRAFEKYAVVRLGGQQSDCAAPVASKRSPAAALVIVPGRRRSPPRPTPTPGTTTRRDE